MPALGNRGLLCVAIAAAASLSLTAAPGAFAATLSNVGGTLTYTGAGAAAASVTVTQTAADVVAVVSEGVGSAQSDPITSFDGCALTGSANGRQEFSCSPVTRLEVDGGAGGDRLSAFNVDTIPSRVLGGDGNDRISPGRGGAVADGGDGDDVFESGQSGAGELFGGAGDDTFMVFVERGDATCPVSTDPPYTFSGGSGLDALVLYPSFFSCEDDVVVGSTNVSLDGQRNDGVLATSWNALPDIERLASDPETAAADTFTGSDGPESLAGGVGADVLDGGKGNDVLSGGPGDDRLVAQDGFADLVDCGSGTDAATVDTFDTVVDCEAVDRQDVGNATAPPATPNDGPNTPEDLPPTITLLTPAANGRVPTGRPTAITATITDDRAVSRVTYVVNGRTVCTATAAPFTCAYSPTGEDVGRTQLVAIVTDSAQQTATALRTVRVDRFMPKLTQTVKRGKGALRFTAAGRLVLPTGVTRAQGCSGVVSVQVKAGKRTISTRRATVAKDCTWRSAVALDSPRRLGKASTLTFVARFTGGTVLDRSGPVTTTAKVG